MDIKQFILEYRQTGSTTNLIKLIKETNGYLIFGSWDQKNVWVKKHPEVKDKLFTLYEALNGKMIGLPKNPIFFDNSTMYSISDMEKETAPSQKDLDIFNKIIDQSEEIKIQWSDNTGFVSNEKRECNKQLNVKLHEEDLEEINSINKEFFEGEASNSMIGRILLRKGIAFYKKFKEMV